MKTIQITGKYSYKGPVLVDDEDYEYLMQWKWNGQNNPTIAGMYAQSSGQIDGKHTTVLMHRIIMMAPEGMEVDHINGNKLDNRKANLRLATSQQNKRNRPKPSNNKSGYKGVCWKAIHKTYVAQIKVNGKHRYLGCSQDPKVASEMYEKAAKELFGEFNCQY